MESNRILLLENFALISVVIPYYGPTHKGFLLLSELCRNTRDKLDELYDEFIKIMVKHRCCLNICNEKCHYFKLPADLFTFHINLETEEITSKFCKFIDRISSKKGYYFNRHHMYQVLNIKGVLINIENIEMLSPYYSLMRSISVYNNQIYGCDDMIDTNLTDKITISKFGICAYNKNNSYVANFIKENREIACYYKMICMSNYKLEDQNKILDNLEQLKSLNFKINTLYLQCDLMTNLELITDSRILKGKINEVKFNQKMNKEISEQTMRNISELIPSKIIFNSIKCEEIIKALSCISENTDISFGDFNSNNMLDLTFKDIFIEIFDSISNISHYIYLKSIKCSIIDLDRANFYIIPQHSDYSVGTIIIYLNCLNSISIKGFKKNLNENETTKIKTIFTYDKLINSSYLAIPIKCLHCVKLGESNISSKLKFSNTQSIISMISSAKTFKCDFALKRLSDLRNIVQFLPKNCEYSICEISLIPKDTINKNSNILSEKEIDSYIAVLSRMKIRRISTSYFIDNKNLKFLSAILDLRTIYENLFALDLKVKTSNTCINILEMCLNFKCIQSIKLTYVEEDCLNEEIHQKIKEFIIKSSIIPEIIKDDG